MMLGMLLFAVLLGVVAGTITGVTPGLHINLVAVILLSSSPFLLQYFSPLVLAAFIIAMSITHTFTDFIASVYLGAPDDDTALSILPGHVLLLRGKGYEAVKLTVVGSFLCLIGTIALIPLLILIVPFIFDHLRPYIGYLLLVIVVFMISRERSLNGKFWALLVFLLSGILGLLVFSLPQVKDPLFPLLSGLFGISMLLMSLTQKVEIPRQYVTEDITLKKREMAKATATGIFSGSLLSIFPGLGPAQAAILASQFYRKVQSHIYLVVVGGINTVTMVMSFVTLYTIDKARNGSIAVVSELLGSFPSSYLILSIAVALIAAGLATFATIWLSKRCAIFINKINYRLLSIAIIFFISSLALFLGGALSLFILGISTAIGLIPALLNIGRNHSMGVLLLPVILYFLL